MKFVKIIFALLLVAVLFKFNLDNKESVSVVLYHYTSPLIPAGLLLMTTFVLGMIAASFGSTLKIVQLKRQISKLQPVSDQDSTSKKKKKDKKKKGDDDVKQEIVDEPQASCEPAPAPVSTPPTDEAVTDAVFEDDDTTVDPAPDVIELPLESATQSPSGPSDLTGRGEK
ncbi:MAG: DUF1049 domain-containing protein [Deltaproteobacteria bacterium]|nr:DUF1049 domain-containing protein [Deltaproteobacteria bacterium]